MASSSSSKMFIGATQEATADHMELMTNSPQDPNPITSMVSPPVEQDQDEYVLMELSPTTILDSNRHICEICYKGFARKQNLTLHRRSHNLPYSLKKSTPNNPPPKKVYLCPEPTCRRNNPALALGDFGGLKKHYLRKHFALKNYKCDICEKSYNVETDLRAHMKTCGKKRAYNFSFHQENYAAARHQGAANHSPALYMEHSSSKTTSNYNRQTIIGSTTSPPHENNNIFSVENPTNLYQSQLCQYGPDYGNHMMANAFLISENPQAFFYPSPPPQQNQHVINDQSSDTRFYADLLTGKTTLNSLNLENANIFSGDHSSSLYSTPAMPNTSLNTINLNAETGYNVVGSSTMNHVNVCGSHEESGFNGYDYRFGSGQFDYEEGARATTGVVPSEQNFSEPRFWF